MTIEIGVRLQRDRAVALRTVLAAASLLAGSIHAAVVPEHLAEDPVLGVAFVVAALFQVAWAILILLRPSAPLAAAGAVASGAMVATWLVSRTAGLPFRHEPWLPEPVGSLDLAATLAELAICAGAIALLRRDRGVPQALMRSRLGSYRGSSESRTG